jgi:hypothetical protein
MPNTLSTAQIEQLKRDAQKLRRATPSLPQHAALDAVAKQHGFPNWSLLAKSVSATVAPQIRAANPFILNRTSDEMRQAMRSVPSVDIRRSDEARALVVNIHSHFVSPLNAIDFAIAYMQLALSQARYRVHPKSVAYFEMRTWLPYTLEATELPNRHILLGRDYKPLGMVQKKDWVDYTAFTNLHVVAKPQEVELILPARYGENEMSWFYGDSPWHSREAAERYLRRLLKFRAWLAGRP